MPFGVSHCVTVDLTKFKLRGVEASKKVLLFEIIFLLLCQISASGLQTVPDMSKAVAAINGGYFWRYNKFEAL